jgi:chromosome segregation ATPase
MEEEIKEIHENLAHLAESCKRLTQKVGSITEALKDVQTLQEAIGVELGHGAAAINDNRNDISVLRQHQQVLRDKLQAMAILVGALDNEPEGSLRWFAEKVEKYITKSLFLGEEEFAYAALTLRQKLKELPNESFPQIIPDEEE